jgi:hypothetical protein
LVISTIEVVWTLLKLGLRDTITDINGTKWISGPFATSRESSHAADTIITNGSSVIKLNGALMVAHGTMLMMDSSSLPTSIATWSRRTILPRLSKRGGFAFYRRVGAITYLCEPGFSSKILVTMASLEKDETDHV